MRFFTTSFLFVGVLAISACTTMNANSINEVTDQQIKSCKLLGPINGSDAIFVGLSASIGSKNAKATAMNAAVALNATHVTWSTMGTTMTNEWVGKAYRCK